MHHSYSPDPLDRRSRREYAVAIFLPIPIDEMIRPLREKYDTDYNIIDSHVTVVFPFETSRDLASVSSCVQKQVEKVRPFDVELYSIGDFYPESPIIYWRIPRCRELEELYVRLYSALELPLPHRKYVPHVTLAREISPHRLLAVKDAIVSYLPHEKFTAESLDLVSPVADGSWLSVRSFKLGGSHPDSL